MNKNYNFNDISNVMHECFDNDIKIYPVVYDKLHFKIEIDFAGRKKLGKEKYNWKTQQKELQKKINELYYEIHKRIQKRK
jgi:hypothetical protein